MTNSLRKSGIEIIGEVPWGTHFCQFYRTPKDLLDILVPYFSEGLRNNEFCMWVTSEPLKTEAARAALAAAVPGLDDYVRRGQLEIIPHTDWYLKGGSFDSGPVLDGWVKKLNAALAAGYEGLRLTGNTFWLEQKDWKAFTDYEAAVDGVIGRYRMLAVCTYSLDRCGANEILDVIANHRFALVRRGGEWERVESTERKRTEKALRESEGKYRLLFQNMAEGFALYELIDDEAGRPVDWRVLEVNDAYTHHTGLPRDRIVGRRIGELFPAAIPDYLPIFSRVVSTQRPESFETFARAVSRHQRIYTFPAGGRRFASTIEDISERKSAEENLRRSEERFRGLFSSMTEGFALHEIVLNEGGDPVDYHFLEVNPSFERLTGLRRDELIGRRVTEILPGIESFWIETYGRVAMTGVPATFERYYPAPLDRWYEIYAYRPAEHQFAVIFMDITDRKKTEALRQALGEQERLRLGAAVEQASDAVVMIDLDGTIQYVNAAFESINKISRDKAIGSSYFDHLAGKSPAIAAMREAIAQGRPWHGHLSGSIAGGRPIELEVTISPGTDPAGKVTGGLITEKDVTQENALQRQVRQSQKMEALGTLAGGITHDFNNILSTIFINTELAMLELDPTNPARRSLPIVLQAANRGRELVKQIITFSRQREWERKPLEVAPIVKEGLKFLRSTLAKDIAIHESIAAECGAVLADPSQVNQILVNLCQNAVLAMSDCAGHLEVRLEPVEVDASLAARHPDLKPGPYVRLTVADTGCGMTPELMERIFEPFFTTRKHGEGSGLGLPVVHGIVKSYDGAITVYSEPGRGSVFNVYIPRLVGEALVSERIKKARPEMGKEHVLLVEDEGAQLKSMARLLERLGYRVTAKPSGRTALTAFKRNPDVFDVVITDQTMPRMTGVELAQALVKVRPDIPIILCTGFSEKVNGETVGHDGIRAFVMKPFTVEEISRHIRAALKKESEAE